VRSPRLRAATSKRGIADVSTMRNLSANKSETTRQISRKATVSRFCQMHSADYRNDYRESLERKREPATDGVVRDGENAPPEIHANMQ
jgi:hypothetical protein